MLFRCSWSLNSCFLNVFLQCFPHFIVRVLLCGLSMGGYPSWAAAEVRSDNVFLIVTPLNVVRNTFMWSPMHGDSRLACLLSCLIHSILCLNQPLSKVALLGSSEQRVACAPDSRSVVALVRVTDTRDVPAVGAEVTSPLQCLICEIEDNNYLSFTM
jgi:hypothetical protein